MPQIPDDLYDYQRQGVDFLTATKRALLASELGTGKTVQALAACERLNNAYPALVVCPNTLKSVWAGELDKWLPDVDYVVIDGTPDQRKRLWNTEAAIHIINYMSLLRDVDQLSSSQFCTVICDEAHKLKNRKSKSFISLKKLARGSTYLFLLTGTPIMTSPVDLWTLLHLIDHRKHSSFWSFVEEFGKRVFNGFAWTPADPDDPSDLAEYLEPYALRHRKVDVLPELPEKTVQQVWVDLDDQQRRDYQVMQDEYFLRLDEQNVVAAQTMIATIGYLRRIAIDPTLVTEEGSGPLRGAKIEALKDLIEGTDEQLVVFSLSKRAIRRLPETLDEPVAVIHGDVDRSTRDELISRFQAGQPRILGATIGVGGMGLTLTAAQTAIFLDRDWVPANNEQAQDRLHRIGQESAVHIIELLASDTIDERIEQLLVGREEVTRGTLADITVDDLVV